MKIWFASLVVALGLMLGMATDAHAQRGRGGVRVGHVGGFNNGFRHVGFSNGFGRVGLGYGFGYGGFGYAAPGFAYVNPGFAYGAPIVAADSVVLAPSVSYGVGVVPTYGSFGFGYGARYGYGARFGAFRTGVRVGGFGHR